MPDDGTVLYAPTIRRRGRRIPVLKLCCYTLVGIIALAVGWLVVQAVKLVLHVNRSVDFPHFDLAISEDRNDNSIGPRIRPLINATTPFQVRATVWLDVTQHLQQFTLPLREDGTPVPVVTYKTGEGDKTRSEAVLYSEVVANMTSWSKAEFRDIALRIPIDPLYTQDLGPSTLRLTTQVEMVDTYQLGDFSFATSAFPPSSALLPRSPDSVRITHGLTSVTPLEDVNATLWRPILRAASLSQALEHSGSSTSLLALIPTTKYINASLCPAEGGNVVTSLVTGSGLPSFLDGAVANQRFATQTQFDSQLRRVYTRGKRCQLLMPHVRAKASVFALPLDKPLDFAGYLSRQSHAKHMPKFERCFALAETALDGDADTSSIANECGTLLSLGPLETFLVFGPLGSMEKVDNRTELGRSLKYYYAPVLRQRSAAAAPHHHHTVPRIRPGGAVNVTVMANVGEKDSHCHLPVLEPDTSSQFFDVTLQLRIASAGNLRLTVSESIFATVGKKPEEDDLLDEDEDVRVRSTLLWDMTWETASVLASDRSDANSKPLVRFVAFSMEFMVSLASRMLKMVYWYTRTTTAGLCIWAQWSMAASAAMYLGKLIYRLGDGANAGVGIVEDAFAIVMRVVVLVLMFMTLLRIDITPTDGSCTWRNMRIRRRPLDKAERQCRLVEGKTFGWQWPLAIVLAFLAYEELVRPHQHILRDGFGCYGDDGSAATEGSPRQRYFDEVDYALEKSALLGQLLFNSVSPALQAQRGGRTGSFAGTFKVVQYMFTLNAYVQMLVGHVKRIGGHVTRRSPISVLHVEMLVLSTVEVYQAWTLPGVPQQTQSEEDGDDD